MYAKSVVSTKSRKTGSKASSLCSLCAKSAFLRPLFAHFKCYLLFGLWLELKHVTQVVIYCLQMVRRSSHVHHALTVEAPTYMLVLSTAQLGVRFPVFFPCLSSLLGKTPQNSHIASGQNRRRFSAQTGT